MKSEQGQEFLELMQIGDHVEKIEFINRKRLKEQQDLYSEFARKKKYPKDWAAKEQSFNDYKKSDSYAQLNKIEKDKLETNPPNKVIVLRFETLDDLKAYFTQLVDKNIVSKETKDRIVEKFEELERQHNKKPSPPK